jgi:hypothetical protein
MSDRAPATPSVPPIEGEVEQRIRYARDSLPGQRDALPQGALGGLPPEPQGDENRDPPPYAPTPPLDAEQRARAGSPEPIGPADPARADPPAFPVQPGGPDSDPRGGRRVSVGGAPRDERERSPAGQDPSSHLP